MPPADPRSAPRTGDRIAKLLARAGIASRREVERMIAEGRVARDGVAIDTPATVLTSLAGITVDGKPVAAPAAARLFVYHKPPGLLVTERDPAGRPTIYDRLPAGLPRVVPVGRLDLATEGLLLLTTDGGLKRQLELPATGVGRTYRARAYGPISQERLEDLIHGIEIDGMRYGPIDANLERRTGANTWIELTLTEGKNREVRRVLEHLGLEVSRLIRTRYGPFMLGDMPAGEVGEIRQHDLVAFRQTLKGGGKGDPAASVVAQPLAAPAPPKPPVAAPRREPADGPRRKPPRSSSAPRERPAAGEGGRGDRQAPSAATRPRGAGERDERPRAFGDRTRAVAAARSARSTGEPRPARSANPSDDRSGRRQSSTTADRRDDRATPRPRPASSPDRGKAVRGDTARSTKDPASVRSTGARSTGTRSADARSTDDRPRGPRPPRGGNTRPRGPAAPRGKR